MKHTVEKQKGKAIISFEADKSEWDNANVQAYEKTKHKFSMNGFRKGKVPMRILLKSYGEDLFFDEAFNILFREAYPPVLEENPDLYPVDSPEIAKIEPNDGGLKFTANVALRPEVKLGAYKGLKIDASSHPVGEKEIGEEIDRALVRTSKKIEITDRAAENGDIANIDYSGAVDGVKFQGGTAQAHELELGSKSFIEGFEEQVVGMKKDEEKAVKCTFPVPYHEKKLEGKEAVFMVKLNGIYKKEKPVLNDDFVKEVSEFQNVEEYKKDIETRLKDSAQKREESENQNNLIEAIVNASEAEIHDCMVEEAAKDMVEEFKYRLMYQGMNIEDYYKHTNTDEEALKKNYYPQAKKSVMSRLVLEDIIKAENIKVEQKDIDNKLQELAKASNKELGEYKKTMDDRRLKYMENEILTDKLLSFLKENNEFVKAKEAGKTAQKPKNG